MPTITDSTNAYVDFTIPGIFSRTGYFSIDTTKTVGEYLIVSGLDFEPKLLLLWWTGGWIPASSDMHNSDYWPVDNTSLNVGFGAASDSTHRFAVVGASDGFGATSNTYRSQNNTEIMRAYTISGSTLALNGILDFHSFYASGYRLVYDNQFDFPYAVGYLALGGSNLSNIYIGYGTLPTTTGYFEISDVGFKADALIITTQAQTSVIQESDNSILSFGWTDGNNQSVVSLLDKDSSSNMITRKYQSLSRIYATINTSTYTINSAGSFIRFTASGFILNNEVGTSQDIFNYIALKGGLYKAKTFKSGGQTGIIYTVSGVGFKPTTLLMNGIMSYTENSVLIDDEISMGFTTIPYGHEKEWRGFSQIAQNTISFDDWPNCTTQWYLSDISYFNPDYWGLLKVLDFVNDGFTFTMLDYDAEYNVNLLAIGAGGYVNVNKYSYLNGATVSSGKVIAFTEGTSSPVVKDYFAAFTKGSISTLSNKACFTSSDYYGISDSSPAYTIGIPLVIDNQNSYIKGQVAVNDFQNSYLSGETRYSKICYTEGYLPNQSIKHAYTNGSDLKYGPDVWIS